ncbi:MAG: DNA polymerase IV [Bacilli bacterium]
MARVILHIDMNAYFSSCAELAQPEYKGKVIAIAHDDNRSVISTASYAARKYGIHSAMPVYQAKKLCPHLILIPPDFALYEYYTKRFVAIIKSFSPIIQMASIDECFVDMSERLKNEKKPLEVIASIQKRIYQETGLSCSIGVAPNKFLAKMASDMKKPMGLTVIRKKEIPVKLWPIPINKMFGVGKKTTAQLLKIGIKTIGDLANYPDDYTLKMLLGVNAYTLKKWAQGIDKSPVKVEQDDPKSIGHSRTLEHNTNDYQELTSLLAKLAKLVSQRAKKEHMLGLSVSLTMKDASFRVKNRSCQLDDYTNDQEVILTSALNLFDKNYRGETLRLLGITLQKTINESDYSQQISLFEPLKPLKNKNEIQNLVKKLNQELGKDLLKIAGGEK